MSRGGSERVSKRTYRRPLHATVARRQPEELVQPRQDHAAQRPRQSTGRGVYRHHRVPPPNDLVSGRFAATGGEIARSDPGGGKRGARARARFFTGDRKSVV